MLTVYPWGQVTVPRCGDRHAWSRGRTSPVRAFELGRFRSRRPRPGRRGQAAGGRSRLLADLRPQVGDTHRCGPSWGDRGGRTARSPSGTTEPCASGRFDGREGLVPGVDQHRLSTRRAVDPSGHRLAGSQHRRPRARLGRPKRDPRGRHPQTGRDSFDVSVALTPDGAQVITGDSAGRVVRWDAVTGEQLGELVASQVDGVDQGRHLPGRVAGPRGPEPGAHRGRSGGTRGRSGRTRAGGAGGVPVGLSGGAGRDPHDHGS